MKNLFSFAVILVMFTACQAPKPPVEETAPVFEEPKSEAENNETNQSDSNKKETDT